MRFKLLYATSNWMFSIGVFGRRSFLDKRSLLRTMAQPKPDLSGSGKPDCSDRGGAPRDERSSTVDSNSHSKRKSGDIIPKKDEVEVKKKRSLNLKDYRQTSKVAETIVNLNKKPSKAKEKEKEQFEGSPPPRRREVESSPSPPRFEDAQHMDFSYLDFSQSNRKPEDYDEKSRPVNKLNVECSGPSKRSPRHSTDKPSLSHMASKLMEERARSAINAQQFARHANHDGNAGALPPCPVPQQIGSGDSFMALWMMEQMNKKFEDFQKEQRELWVKSSNPGDKKDASLDNKSEDDEAEEDMEEDSAVAAWSGFRYDFKTETVTLSEASIEFWSGILGIDEKGQKELTFKKNWSNPSKLNFFLGNTKFKPPKINAEFPKYTPWQAKEETDLCQMQKFSGAAASATCTAVDSLRSLITDLHSSAVDFREGEFDDPSEEGEKICKLMIKLLEEGVIANLIHSLRFSASSFGFCNLKRHNLALKTVTADDAKKVLADSPPDGEWLFGQEVKNSVQRIRDSSLIGKAFVKNDYYKPGYGKGGFRGRGRGRGFKTPEYTPRGRRFKGRGYQYRDTRGRQDGDKDKRKKEDKDG